MPRLFVFGIGGTGARVIKSLTMLLASGIKAGDFDIIPVLIDPHNVQSIADGIIEMIQSDTARLQTGLQSREKATNYYGGRLLDELLNTYRSFLR